MCQGREPALWAPSLHLQRGWIKSVQSNSLQYSTPLSFFLHPPLTPFSGKVLTARPWESVCVCVCCSQQARPAVCPSKKNGSRDIGLTPANDSSCKSSKCTFLPKLPNRRRSSIRPSPGAPTTAPLLVNPGGSSLLMRSSLPSRYLLLYRAVTELTPYFAPRGSCKSSRACYSSGTASCSCGVFSRFKKLMRHWLVTARGYRPELAACVSTLSISSHQAISRALSLNISSDQIDWKGVIRFEHRSMSLCVWAVRWNPSAVTWVRHHAINKQGPLRSTWIRAVLTSWPLFFFFSLK